MLSVESASCKSSNYEPRNSYNSQSTPFHLTPANHQSAFEFDANQCLLDIDDSPSHHAYSIKDAGIDLDAIEQSSQMLSAEITVKETPGGDQDHYSPVMQHTETPSPAPPQ